MALHTKTQFAVLCGFTDENGKGISRKLSIYKLRNKIVYSGDYVDDTILINAAFLKEMSAKSKLATLTKPKKPVLVEKKIIQPLNTKEIKEETEQQETKQKETEQVDEFDKEFQDMALEKKSLEIKELKQKIKKLELGNNKTQGDYVSIDLVKNLLVLHSECVKNSYENGLQEFIVQFSHKNKLPREDVFQMKAEVINVVNSTMVKSIEETKKALRRMQTDISNKRGVGERL